MASNGKPLPEIKGTKPVGTGILIELLTAQEMMGTTLFVDEDSKIPVHQAYVLDIGPKVPEDYGIKKGDRVWISGSICFAPNYDNSPRKRGTLEFNMIKGVIVEG